MKKDIETRADIDELMNHFYSKATKDDLIGFIFTDVAKLELEHHLPIIGDFWETLLFRTGNYQRHKRNPLQIHGELNLKTPLRLEHFRRWLEIFRHTQLTNCLPESEPNLLNCAPKRLPIKC